MLRVPARRWAFAYVGVGLAITMFTCAGQAQPTTPPTKAQLEEAQAHQTAGSNLYNDPSGPPGAKCEEAIPEFRRAYDLSGSWKAVRALAICEQKLERDQLALQHYQEALQRGGDQIPPPDRAQIEQDVLTLKTAMATIRIKTNQPNARLVATRQLSQGLPVTNRYAVTADGITVGIHPGSYVFTAQADGFPDVVWQADVTNGSVVEHNFEFTFKPDIAPSKTVETERPVPVTVWIFTGITGACAVTSGVFMGLSKVAKNDYDEVNGISTDRTELEDKRSDVITKNIVADVFLGLTAVSFATTLIFYFTRPSVPLERGRGPRAAWMVAPAVGPSTYGASFFTSF